MKSISYQKDLCWTIQLGRLYGDCSWDYICLNTNFESDFTALIKSVSCFFSCCDVTVDDDQQLLANCFISLHCLKNVQALYLNTIVGKSYLNQACSKSNAKHWKTMKSKRRKTYFVNRKSKLFDFGNQHFSHIYLDTKQSIKWRYCNTSWPNIVHGF